MATVVMMRENKRREGEPARASPTTDAIFDALALRHGEWDARRPDVLPLAAAALAELHAALSGRVARLEQLRPAKYLREALRGERALAVEDLALLALDEPEALLAGLAVLARAARARIVPLKVLASSGENPHGEREEITDAEAGAVLRVLLRRLA